MTAKPHFKTADLSLVIPCYNEQRRIKACLESVARQTVRPSEVLLVDNNSTDGTLRLARQFDFVTILKQPRQGVVFARNAGFDAGAIVAIECVVSGLTTVHTHNLLIADVMRVHLGAKLPPLLYMEGGYINYLRLASRSAAGPLEIDLARAST